MLFFLILLISFMGSYGAPVRKRSDVPSNWRDLITDEAYRAHVNRPRGHNHLFESDIKKDDFRQDTNGRFRNAIVDRSLRWERGIVPYEVSDAYTDEERTVIDSALRDMETKTCIRFVARDASHKDYISFVKRNRGCSSYVGRTGGAQQIDLMVGCLYQIGDVQHEVMHALGFYHEQSRSDRDQYVQIVWSNIISGAEDQFTTYITDNLDMPYDYDSIMHFGWNYFAKDTSLPTIVPRTQPNNPKGLGNRKVMTMYDAEKIKRLYECHLQNPATVAPQTQRPPRPSWNTPPPPVTTRPGRRPPRPTADHRHAEGTSLWSRFKDMIRDSLRDNGNT